MVFLLKNVARKDVLATAISFGLGIAFFPEAVFGVVVFAGVPAGLVVSLVLANSAAQKATAANRSKKEP